MAGTESLRQVAHSRAPLSTWFGIVLLFALFGIIVLAVIGPAPRGSDYEETRAQKRVNNLKTSREEAAKALATYGWIDKNKGVARIPIERAMNATGIPLKEPSVSAAAGDAEQLERALIDASTRVPVLMFYTSAIAWLILGTLLAGFVSFKLHTPDLFSDISFLTWGRVRPAHMK